MFWMGAMIFRAREWVNVFLWLSFSALIESAKRTVSIEPGALAPGIVQTKGCGARASGRERCRPLRGLDRLLYLFPGADAPGFMLSPAAQAQALKTN